MRAISSVIFIASISASVACAEDGIQKEVKIDADQILELAASSRVGCIRTFSLAMVGSAVSDRDQVSDTALGRASGAIAQAEGITDEARSVWLQLTASAITRALADDAASVGTHLRMLQQCQDLANSITDQVKAQTGG